MVRSAGESAQKLLEMVICDVRLAALFALGIVLKLNKTVIEISHRCLLEQNEARAAVISKRPALAPKPVSHTTRAPSGPSEA